MAINRVNLGGRIIDNLQIDNRQIDNRQTDNQNRQIDNLQITFILEFKINNLQIYIFQCNYFA